MLQFVEFLDNNFFDVVVVFVVVVVVLLFVVCLPGYLCEVVVVEVDGPDTLQTTEGAALDAGQRRHLDSQRRCLGVKQRQKTTFSWRTTIWTTLSWKIMTISCDNDDN